MKKRLLAGLGVFVLTSHSAGAQTLNIDHQPVACAVAEKFPRLEARFSPADTVAKARVLFQGANTEEWYAVVMKSEGSAFSGVLPKPMKSLKAYRYYIEVTDKALGTNRTADFTTNVVENASVCKGKIMAAALGSASVLLQVPAGAAALPAGFASTGVVAAGSVAGAPGATLAGGGGIPTAVLVGAGVVAAGTGAVVVAKGREAKTIMLEGTVYRGVCSCFEQPGSPRLGAPIPGALVSTSLDSRTAVTDGVGHFLLVTTGAKGKTYTHTISAAGCQTFSVTGQADDSTGPNAQTYSLNCS